MGRNEGLQRRQGVAHGTGERVRGRWDGVPVDPQSGALTRLRHGPTHCTGSGCRGLCRRAAGDYSAGGSGCGARAPRLGGGARSLRRGGGARSLRRGRGFRFLRRGGGTQALRRRGELRLYAYSSLYARSGPFEWFGDALDSGPIPPPSNPSRCHGRRAQSLRRGGGGRSHVSRVAPRVSRGTCD